MNTRVSTISHESAQRLLKMPGTTVQYQEVDLGTATSSSDKNRILRHFEQREMNKQIKNGKNLTNEIRAEAAKKFERNKRIVQRRGASAGPKKTC